MSPKPSNASASGSAGGADAFLSLPALLELELEMLPGELLLLAALDCAAGDCTGAGVTSAAGEAAGGADGSGFESGSKSCSKSALLFDNGAAGAEGLAASASRST